MADDYATIYTNMGDIKIRFFERERPKTVKHFKQMVEKGIYTHTHFYRVVKGFFIQGGVGYDEAMTSKSVVSEFTDLRLNLKGTMAFAWQDLNNPDSGTSEFYICLTDLPALDRLKFTVFAEVIEGLEVLEKIANTPVEENYRYLDSETKQWVSEPSENTNLVAWHQPLAPVMIKDIKLHK